MREAERRRRLPERGDFAPPPSGTRRRERPSVFASIRPFDAARFRSVAFADFVMADTSYMAGSHVCVCLRWMLALSVSALMGVPRDRSCPQIGSRGSPPEDVLFSQRGACPGHSSPATACVCPHWSGRIPFLASQSCLVLSGSAFDWNPAFAFPMSCRNASTQRRATDSLVISHSASSVILLRIDGRLAMDSNTAATSIECSAKPRRAVSTLPSSDRRFPHAVLLSVVFSITSVPTGCLGLSPHGRGRQGLNANDGHRVLVSCHSSDVG